MGSTTSSSTINDSLNDALTQSNNITQGGTGNQACVQRVTFKNCDIEAPVTLTCDQQIHMDFNQDGKVKAASSMDVAQALQAQSEAKGQNISANPGKTEADSTIDSITDLSDTMQNTISQDTTTNELTEQTLGCVDTTYGKGAPIYIGSSVDAMLKASQKAIIDSAQGQNLKQDMSAKSKAVTENALTSVIIAIALCLAVVFIGPEVGIGIIVKDVMGSKIFILVGLVGAVVFWFYAIRSCGYTGQHRRGWPCYKGCLYAPPTPFGKKLANKIPIAKQIFGTPGGDDGIDTMLNNPCCANCPEDEKCATTKDNNLQNKRCFGDTEAQPDSDKKVCKYDKDNTNKCNKAQDQLATACKWTDSGGKQQTGKCEGHRRKGVVWFLVVTLVIILGIIVLLYDFIKNAGSGKGTGGNGKKATGSVKGTGGAKAKAVKAKAKGGGGIGRIFGFGGDTRGDQTCGRYPKCSSHYKVCMEGKGRSISHCESIFSRLHLFGKKITGNVKRK
jgi:hypothetical protein